MTPETRRQLEAALRLEIVESLRQATWPNTIWRERALDAIAPVVERLEQRNCTDDVVSAPKETVSGGFLRSGDMGDAVWSPLSPTELDEIQQRPQFELVTDSQANKFMMFTAEERDRLVAMARRLSDVLDEYRDVALTKAECDACEQCGPLVMCEFHSLLSAVRGNTWTNAAIQRDNERRRRERAREL